ncbi:HTTM domain-containing protein [Leucobacter chromiireducens]|uniref:HTTM domain-containing protein n=1 Tax=Leucobacter chromiireducens TaxID=283877 RepID=UPI000F63262F|nr:HTTM domain-containing protein [Leucobacter chromiireducens]
MSRETSLTRGVSGNAVGRLWDGVLRWLTETRHASYGIALMRMGFGAMTVIILALYLPNLSYSFGAGSRWGEALFRNSSVNNYLWPIPQLFARDESDTLLVIKVLVLMAVAVLYALGWRMRVVSPLFVVLWLGFAVTNPVILNTGHYQTFRIFLLFLLLADTSRRWSLDARRRARRGGSDAPLGVGRWHLPRWIPVLAHNVAVILIAYQLCVIYVTSALWKLQGTTWVSGVAAYYPLQLEELTLFPWLNHLAWQFTPAVFVASWLSVYGQLLFPLFLLHRWTRILGLVLVTGMHASIGILLALPWFSLMMILGDMIFIRDQTWERVSGWVRERLPLRRRRPAPPSAAPPAEPTAAPGTELGEAVPALT